MVSGSKKPIFLHCLSFKHLLNSILISSNFRSSIKISISWSYASGYHWFQEEEKFLLGLSIYAGFLICSPAGITPWCDALRDLVPFVQLKKRQKDPQRGATFIRFQPATLLKVSLFHGCFSRFLNCTIKSRRMSHKICKLPGQLHDKRL